MKNSDRLLPAKPNTNIKKQNIAHHLSSQGCFIFFPFSHIFLEQEICHGKIQKCHASRIKHRDVGIAFTTRSLSKNEITKLSTDSIFRQCALLQGNLNFSGVPAVFEVVHKNNGILKRNPVKVRLNFGNVLRNILQGG